MWGWCGRLPGTGRVRLAGSTGCMCVDERGVAGHQGGCRACRVEPTAYAGEAAVAAARALVADSGTGATRAELAAVQREVFAARSALVQAVQASPGSPDRGSGEIGVVMVERLDAIAERLHVLLKRASR